MGLQTDNKLGEVKTVILSIIGGLKAGGRSNSAKKYYAHSMNVTDHDPRQFKESIIFLDEYLFRSSSLMMMQSSTL